MSLLPVDTKLYHTRINLWLTPRINIEAPDVTITLNQDIVYQGPLTTSTCFDIDRQLSLGQHTLAVNFTNKKDTDTDMVTGADKAVIVDRVIFNDIESPRFVWNGVYCPDYPEPWATEQRQAGHTLEPLLKSYNYLGWNGQWSLTFTTPIFTWIHQVEDLGWIYN